MAAGSSSSSLGRRRSRNIPEEIVEQILARLPVKSLLRFESACKTWYSLIRSRPFINLHYRYHHPHQQYHNNLFLLCNYNPASKSYAISSINPCSSPPPPSHLRRLSDVPAKTLFEFRLPETLTLGRCPWDGGGSGPVEFPCFRMIGPSEHGIYCFISDLFLVAIRAFNSTSTRINSTLCSANIALANLATRRIRVIPPFPLDKVARQCAYYNTSWRTKTEFGFGCIQNDEYKVVVIVQLKRNFKSIAFVYSSKRASWNQICDFKSSNKRPALAGLLINEQVVRFPEILHYHDPLRKRMVRHSNCSFLNGSCHWVASVMLEQEYYCILVFDMRSEVFSSMRGPPSAHGGGYLRREIFVVKGHIGVALIHGSGVDLWMMMVYGDEGSWVEFGRCSCGGFGCLVPSLLGLSLGSDDSDDRLYLEGCGATLFDASFRLNDDFDLDLQRPCLYSFALGFHPPNFETLEPALPA